MISWQTRLWRSLRGEHAVRNAWIAGFAGLAGVAILALRLTLADATPLAPEAENAATTGSAKAVDDATASSGRSLKFAVATSGGAAPANPNLNQAGRNVLNYLHSIEGQHVLAGQQETDQCATCESDRLKQMTGKAPVVHGHETGDYAFDPMQTAIDDWNTRNQIPEFSWHMGAPPQDDNDWNNSASQTDVEKVLQSGTNENTVFMAKLDKMAGRLQALKTAGVPVLWRPFHEMNGSGGGWFWWSYGGSDAYKRLWTTMFNYFTQTKGLDNLIWVWSASESGLPSADWYPGDQYVDILGSDTYGGNSDMDNWANHYAKHKEIASSKLVALTETDLIPDPSQLQSRQVKLMWFLPWYGQWLDKNGQSTLNSIYNHAYVITADEMPSLK